MKNKSPNSCFCCGICCKLFLINLNKKEWESNFYQTMFTGFPREDSFDKVKSYGGNLLRQKKDGSCIYLKNNLCSIHTMRPQICRNFNCTSKAKKYQTMIMEISRTKNFLG